ncbi:hypothetical protein VPH35_068016 [Triticum aestivum]
MYVRSYVKNSLEKLRVPSYKILLSNTFASDWFFVLITDDNPSYVCHRFSEGAQLNSVTWLEIRGGIHTDMLTPDSKYGAYLVFKRTQNFSGFNYPIQKATLYFGQIMEYTSPVLLGENWTPPPELGVAQPQRRADGWMEISLGHFHTSGNELYAEMSFSLMETEGEVTQKRGLIVHGIEIRREKSG